MPQTYTTQTYTTQITATSIAAILKKLPAKKPLSSAALQNSATDCNHCTGFDNCQYPGHRGYHPIFTEHGTALTACRYLAAWKTQRRQDNLQATSGIPIAYQHLDFRDFKYHSGTYQALLAARCNTPQPPKCSCNCAIQTTPAKNAFAIIKTYQSCSSTTLAKNGPATTARSNYTWS